jgi:hypothetical protein
MRRSGRRPDEERVASFGAADAAGFGEGLGSAKPPDEKKKEPKPKKEKEKPKPKPPKKKLKNKAKQNEKTEPDLRAFGEATTAAEAPSDEVAGLGSAVASASTEAKSPSPRKSIARAFRRKTLFEQDDAPQDKPPTKKPLTSPKKRYVWKPRCLHMSSSFARSLLLRSLQSDEATEAREEAQTRRQEETRGQAPGRSC